MKRFSVPGRALALLAVILPLLGLFIFVALRSGPLAPVAVTVTTVETAAVTPSLFGLGVVESRHLVSIGPTAAGRLQRLEVDVGDSVQAGQVIGGMDPVDLEQRLLAQDAAFRRIQAQLREARARQTYAQAQAKRYEQLFAANLTSEEMLAAKRQELQITDAGLAALHEDQSRITADRGALAAQQRNLQLTAPVNGLVVARHADPGATVVAGQAVIEVIDPAGLWVNARFDQVTAAGLRAGLPARIELRSRAGQVLAGRVLRVEPMADAVTEETRAKVLFLTPPAPLPPLGELAEVTLALPSLAATPVLPNAAVRRDGGETGVWKVVEGGVRFTPVQLGAGDLEGRVQVLSGVARGDRVVVYSAKALKADSRITIVERIPGAGK